jgi:filamentous hemagglutinin family protein
MVQGMRGWIAVGPIGLLFGWLGFALPAIAQVQVDGFLGSESSIVTTTGSQDVIGGGAVRGGNLFHSFQELNVAAGRSLFFANPDGISRIFGRITGGQSSQILGTLGVLGNADLILINPAGISFGPESRLALGGSFLGTTAERIAFADGRTFSVGNPESNALLTIATPTGLQMGNLSGPIVNQSRADGVGLTIAPQKTLALVGGNITLDGGQITTQSGRIELLSISNTVVDLVPNGSGFGLTTATGSDGTIRLQNQAKVTSQTTIDNPAAQIHLLGGLLQLQDQSEVQTVNASNAAGADIEIQAQTLQMSGGARVMTTATGSGQGGSIHGAIANQIMIDGNNPDKPKNLSGFSSLTFGAGAGGHLTLTTNQLNLPQGGVIWTTTQGTGRGGSIDINATQAIESTGISPLFPAFGGVILAITASPGAGGDVTIATGNLTLANGAGIQTATFVDGPAGNLSIRVLGRAQFSGANPLVPLFPSGLIAPVYGSGRGGDLQLITNDLVIESGATVLTNNVSRDLIARLIDEPGLVGLANGGTGDIGNIQVQAKSITIRGINALLPESASQIGSLTFLEGDAGDVQVSTQSLRLEAGGLVVSSSVLGIAAFQPFLPSPTLSRGDGGDLTIKAESIVVDGANRVTGLSSILGTQTVGSGSSGNTQIDTGTLLITNGGLVSASTIASGNAGNLVVNARDSIEVTGVNANGQASALITDATVAPLTIQQRLLLPDATPTGNTGTLQITTPLLMIREGGTVGVQHSGLGNAGQLNLTADRLILDQGGLLTAETASGRGGNLDLQIRDLVLLRRGSQITAEVSGGSGNGGNLNINAGFMVAPAFENSDITANAFGGKGGTIKLRTEALFGLQFRDRRTASSDITASSGVGLNGLVQIDQQSFSDRPDFLDVSIDFLDESRQIVTGCDRQSTSSFVLTGRGGVPADPRDSSSDLKGLHDWRMVLDDWPKGSVPPGPAQSRSTPLESTPLESTPIQSTPSPIEAQGIVRTSQGTIALTATADSQMPIGRPTCMTARSPAPKSAP